jgi:hypothetical protein
MSSDPYLPPGCTNRDIDGPEEAQEGYDAYHDGLESDANPYPWGSSDYHYWHEGWLGARDRDVDAAGLDGPLDRPARQAPKGLQFRADDKPDETEVDDDK